MVRYKFFKGTGNKKYKVEIYIAGKKVKTTQFGDNRYGQYKDKVKLGLYTAKNNMDKERRKKYYQRHGKDAKKWSAKYFSHKYLW
tara:strand:- start:257 stop:511 length:255 start_codon:yes stop_codon:yes gene_type:complete